MATTLYGIKNCDTIKKARRFLEELGSEYTFHDYRVDGIDKKTVQEFIDKLGFDKVLNKRGTTWRQLDEKIKDSTTASNAASLLCEHPAMIKRPILRTGKTLLIGFSVKDYESALKANR